MAQVQAQPPTIYKQGNPPDQTYPLINPIPWIDDLWVDIVNHLVKRCTQINPYVWVSIEGGGSGGPSVNDPFVTWMTAADLTNQKVIGSFLTSVLQTALPFARGGTVLSPTTAVDVIVWQAPFPCTVTNVRGYTADATGTTVNARKNGSLTHLAADLTLTSAATWLDGGAVQNTSYSTGDKMEIMLTSIVGSPSQIAIQVDFTRP